MQTGKRISLECFVRTRTTADGVREAQRYFKKVFGYADRKKIYYGMFREDAKQGRWF